MAVPVIFGPTAVGKTKLAIELAQKINGEIISADSMQVYRGMDIGTAKPTLEERQGIPHHLIDIRDPDEEWTVSDFIGESQNSKVKIQNKGKIPIIVGGTGLYLWSLLEGFAFPITPGDKELRERLEKAPAPTLYARLSAIDPVAAAKIHANDKKRIIRALEVYELTGEPITELQKIRVNSPHLNVGNYDYLLIGLDLPRPELYERINARVDNMIAGGLIDEVRGLLDKGYSKELNSFQALGYKEAVEYLDGGWTKEQMTDELKKRTRAFARRQLTWFRRFKDVHWFEANTLSLSDLCALVP
ncbi:MAG: tRNA (adenosine(37)-N6)-dimethylallyltransferase MiaA [Candidatus Saganbacteria bacterium]|nr:tRNA (adenosine(37)-N6)-dimethylallyltransferase MiaA [Candidatus Saganbacteria bacterium]